MMTNKNMSARLEGDAEDVHVEVSVCGGGRPRSGRRETHMDGGYSWVVLVCSFTIMFLSSVNWTSFGVYLLEFNEQYPTHSGLFAWMFSLYCGVQGFVGLVAGRVVSAYSPRVGVIVGALFISSGYLIGAFAPNPWIPFLAYGLLVGTGNAFTNMASTVAVQQYFSKRRSLASGLYLTGGALALFVVPPLVVFLISVYGWRGAYLLQSASILHAIPLSLLIPPRVHAITTANDTVTSSVKEQNEQENILHKVGICLHKTCACHLLSRPPFILFNIGVFLLMFAHNTPVVFTVSRAVHLGISRQNAALVMSSWAITSMCGRVLIGWLGDKVKRSILLPGCVFLAGAVTLLSIFCRAFELQIIYAAVYGFLLAGYIAIKIPVMVDILGVENIASANGVNILMIGTAGVLGSPVASAIKEETGDFTASFLMAGICMFASGVFMVATVAYNPCRARCSEKRSTERTYADTEYAEMKMAAGHVTQKDWPIHFSSVHSLTTMDGV